MSIVDRTRRIAGSRAARYTVFVVVAVCAVYFYRLDPWHLTTFVLTGSAMGFHNARALARFRAGEAGRHWSSRRGTARFGGGRDCHCDLGFLVPADAGGMARRLPRSSYGHGHRRPGKNRSWGQPGVGAVLLGAFGDLLPVEPLPAVRKRRSFRQPDDVEIANRVVPGWRVPDHSRRRGDCSCP